MIIVNSNIFKNNNSSKSLIDPDLTILGNPITKAILTEWYKFRYFNSGESDVHTLKNTSNWNGNIVQKIINHLEALNWITCYNFHGKYTLTGVGALESEQRGFIDSNIAKVHNNERIKILKHLSSRYESSSRHDTYSNESFAQDYGRSYNDIAVYLVDLEQLGYLDFTKNRLKDAGFQRIQWEIEWEEIQHDFIQIKLLPPQARGIEFEKLFARVLRIEDWDVEHSVRNENEENDLFISHERENYLVEMKWLNKPVEASQIRELIGKIGNRIGVNGIFLSMSGFTSGAISQVREQRSNYIVYLFGPKDLEMILSRSKTFNNILSEKHKWLLLKKESIWS